MYWSDLTCIVVLRISGVLACAYLWRACVCGEYGVFKVWVGSPQWGTGRF